MASLAQTEANRRNAKRSTGPRTPEGKAAVARNGVTHGLSSNKFFLLPWEDPSEWEALLSGLIAEHQPSTPTEEFLVIEMARAQWKLNRLAHIEHEILAGQDGATDWPELALQWRRDCANSQKTERLERYETSLRRAWYRALATLLKLRKSTAKPEASENDKAKPVAEAQRTEALARQEQPADTREPQPCDRFTLHERLLAPRVPSTRNSDGVCRDGGAAELHPD